MYSIGIAMFEIYHAVQYYAIVWIYNRRLFRRAGEHFGPLGFLFSDRWTMLGLYLAAIAAYSSIRFFTVGTNAYIFSGSSEDAYQWLVALFVTSSFLHFYFDGFIWKVSERKTQENLVDAPNQNAPAMLMVPAVAHAAKWAVLLAIVVGLLLAEKNRLHESPTDQLRRMAALAALTPNLPECQAMLCRDALSRGDAATAIAFAEKTIKMRPRSHTAHADLGLAYLLAGRLADAQQHFEAAAALAPREWSHHCDLGSVLVAQGNVERAESELKQAVQLAPDIAEPYEQLAQMYLEQNRTAEASEAYATIAERFPHSLSGELGKIMLLNRAGKHHKAAELANFLAAGNGDNWRVLLALGTSLNAAGEPDQAITPLEKAISLRPNSAELYYQLGLVNFQLGQLPQALSSLAQALNLDHKHFGAQLQLANTYLVVGESEAARKAYQRALKLQPADPVANANYGGLLAQLGEYQEAERIYRAALERTPDSQQLNYNLGLLLWLNGEQAEARQLIQKAENLGMTLSPEVKAAISTTGEATVN